MRITNIFKIFVVIICLGISSNLSAQAIKDFTLVLDAGHGGKDPGAIGKKSKEKDIVLAVALMVGEKIERNHRNVNVLYTRKTDTYPTLKERSAFANRNHADLFISIHANATGNTSVSGAETFLLGVDKMDDNLGVAMKENAVMLLEDDYKTNYEGFNPNSVESYIMFEFMQNQHMDNSVVLASLTQQQLIGPCRRKDRGVKQAPFWLLYSVACPSILIELGFISNPADETYMLSKTGQTALADGIYKAFNEYKRNIDAHDKVEIVRETPAPKPQVKSNEKAVFKLQILSSKEKLRTRDRAFKGERNADYYVEGGIYKYTLGADTDYTQIAKLKKEVARKFPDAFVIAFRGNKKISISEARGN